MADKDLYGGLIRLHILHQPAEEPMLVEFAHPPQKM